jgi:K+-transporting ATPase KdpF subunit
MSAGDVLGLVLAVALFAYLCYALFAAERF